MRLIADYISSRERAQESIQNVSQRGKKKENTEREQEA